MLIFICAKFNFVIIFIALSINACLDVALLLSVSIQNLINLYNYSLKISASIFFFILGLKYILDNTRFSIKENNSKNNDKSNCTKSNYYSAKEEKSNYNNSNVSKSSENLIYSSNNYTDYNNNNNFNGLKINSSGSDIFESEKEVENEKSFIFYNKIECAFENKTILGFNGLKILLGFENVLLCVVIILLASLLDKQKWFTIPEAFLRREVLFSNKINEKELNAGIISSIICILIAFCFGKLLNKLSNKKKITFHFGFVILIYFGIYSIYNTVSNKKTYHIRKIMLSNQIEKNNPNVFLKKKDLEKHFLVNNSKLVKNKILNKNKIQKEINENNKKAKNTQNQIS